MGDLGFSFVSEVPTPVKLLFGALGLLLLVWVLIGVVYGGKGKDPDGTP